MSAKRGMLDFGCWMLVDWCAGTGFANIQHLTSNIQIFDSDLAHLYQVQTKALNLAVKRNVTRVPDDFMFRLSKEEDESLRFQFETSKKGRGGRR